MNNQFRRLLIIDGSYMLHRPLHIPELFAMTNSKGERVGGMYQFLKSLSFEISRHSKYYPVVCWDNGLSDRRVKLFPEYKDRELRNYGYTAEQVSEIDEYLKAYQFQRDTLIEMLKSFGIPSIRISGWECDDLIYVLTKLTDDCVIVSDDKDFYQLVSDGITVSRPLAKEIITTDSLSNQGTSAYLCLITKCITGDKSDNIPKVADGLGEKNAFRVATVIQENPETYLEILGESDKKVDQRFVENHDTYLLNQKLINLKEVDQDITSDVLQIVKNSITSILGKSHYFKASQWIGTYELVGIDVDSMMLFLKSPFRHLIES